MAKPQNMTRAQVDCGFNFAINELINELLVFSKEIDYNKTVLKSKDRQLLIAFLWPVEIFWRVMPQFRMKLVNEESLQRKWINDTVHR